MDNLLMLLAAPTPAEVQRRAEGFFSVAKDYLTTHWYFTVPGGFVAVFLVIYLVARAKMK